MPEVTDEFACSGRDRRVHCERSEEHDTERAPPPPSAHRRGCHLPRRGAWRCCRGGALSACRRRPWRPSRWRLDRGPRRWPAPQPPRHRGRCESAFAELIGEDDLTASTLGRPPHRRIPWTEARVRRSPATGPNPLKITHSIRGSDPTENGTYDWGSTQTAIGALVIACRNAPVRVALPAKCGSFDCCSGGA